MSSPASDETRELESFYQREGYAGPFEATGSENLERSMIVSQLEALRADADPEDAEWRWGRNRHLDVPAIAELCRNQNVIERVKAILGRDLLLWRSQIFVHAARGMGMGWHKDEYETLLHSPSGASHCSVQINLVSSTKTNCLAFIPRSHRWDAATLRAKGCTLAPNLRYQEWHVTRDVDVVDVPMKAGEFVVFHPGLLHASVWSRTLRLGGRNVLARRFARWSTSLRARLTPDTSRRHAITLRIATPSTRILPEAFAWTPTRASSVLLSGADAFEHNRLGSWPDSAPRARD